MCLFIAMAVVPAIELSIKSALRVPRATGLSLGPLGRVRLIRSEVVARRLWPGVRLPAMWLIWLTAAAALISVATLLPSIRCGAGLLLGGSLSHALERSWRGHVDDYICLRFWPAFDGADVAIVLGSAAALVAMAEIVARSLA